MECTKSHIIIHNHLHVAESTHNGNISASSSWRRICSFSACTLPLDPRVSVASRNICLHLSKICCQPDEICHNARKRKSNTNDNLKREDDTRSEEKSSNILRNLKGNRGERFLLIPKTLGAGKGREWEGKGGQLVEFFAEYARHKLGHGVERREE